ncbi:MAG TPA: 2Fe-2S iron-sulfur cluster-binding protein [Allosphingosinicella sp.]|nr:2Fe-2S iron-sulfur cluster-binding protein [Allosphingosinicella sp.]
MSVNFHRLEVAELIPETAEAKSIRFAVPPELRESFRFKPGQHLTLKAQIRNEEVRRNYSLCVAPGEGELKVTVKRIAGGLFSTWANEALKPGDRLDVMEPHGSFTWDFRPEVANHYAAFAGGSGITPIISLIKTAMIEEPESRFTLFYGNRDSQSVIFLEELARLKNRFMERLEVHHFLAEEAEDIDLFNGMLDPAKCGDVLETLIEPADVAAFFICGPGPMMDAAEGALLERGVARERIHIERFTADRPPEALQAQLEAFSKEAQGLTMLVTLDGRKRRVPFSAEAGNILDSARLAGLPAPFACKAGVCATCRARIVSGEVEMAARYGLTDEEVADGYVLTCQSVPKGAGLEVDYDA